MGGLEEYFSYVGLLSLQGNPRLSVLSTQNYLRTHNMSPYEQGRRLFDEKEKIRLLAWKNAAVRDLLPPVFSEADNSLLQIYLRVKKHWIHDQHPNRCSENTDLYSRYRLLLKARVGPSLTLFEDGKSILGVGRINSKCGISYLLIEQELPSSCMSFLNPAFRLQDTNLIRQEALEFTAGTLEAYARKFGTKRSVQPIDSANLEIFSLLHEHGHGSKQETLKTLVDQQKLNCAKVEIWQIALNDRMCEYLADYSAYKTLEHTGDLEKIRESLLLWNLMCGFWVQAYALVAKSPTRELERQVKIFEDKLVTRKQAGEGAFHAVNAATKDLERTALDALTKDLNRLPVRKDAWDQKI